MERVDSRKIGRAGFRLPRSALGAEQGLTKGLRCQRRTPFALNSSDSLTTRELQIYV
jgi:hypothetical protein